MKSLPKPHFERVRMMKQRGLVLFFALIALLALSLAAVALIRSVDTSTLIAGNLAFKQAAATSGDAGVEAAVSWLTAMQTANSAKNVLKDSTHAFNVTNAASGYYANADSTKSLTNPTGTGFKWDNTDSTLVLPDPDSSGNTIRYIIQRICSNTGPPPTANCSSSQANSPGNEEEPDKPPLRDPKFYCRITARVEGPRNTISYIQSTVSLKP